MGSGTDRAGERSSGRGVGSAADTVDPRLDDTLPAPASGPPSSPSTPAPVTFPDGRRGLPLHLEGRFQGLSLLGEGGMGAVYRAHDRRLGRDVALKLLKSADPSRKPRLLREARAQARIEHPNVCRVYEVGEADGEPYIVMQLVDGPPLLRLQGRLTLAQRVAVLRDVAAAVHAAHLLGLVHRDIKPGNILVERRAGGTLTPYLVDFGLARELHGGDRTTGGGLGTPAYMAPEQISGVSRSDARTDVYGLGATLYELCAGRPPYHDDDIMRLLARITVEDPPSLGSVGHEIPVELEAIVMKCLERDPARRYASALSLAEDLGRFLGGEPVQARRLGRAARWWRRARRHRAALALGAAALGATIALSGALLSERRGAAAAAQIERELAQEAVAMELLMRNAYQMPLHDVERERRVVRERLAAIERRLAEGGRIDHGPAEYALGRGRLALGELEAARAHLERARAAGYAPPELDYALATAMLLLYERHRRDAEPMKDEAARKARLVEIDERYRRPALVLLRVALPARIEAPAYAEALLAFHEERWQDAIAKARGAFEASPLLYEAKRLEGDAHVELVGVAWKGRAPGWWGDAARHIEAAGEAYRAAEDIARSDPELLDHICFLWTRAMYAASYQGAPTRAHFERAREACGRAVQADGSSGRARLARAEMHVLHAYALANNPEPGEDPRSPIEEAIRFGEEAVAAGHEPARAKEALANALRGKILVESAAGRDALPAVARATTVYEELIRDFPHRRGAWNASLALVYIFRATQERWRGVDVTRTVERGLRVLDESLAGGAGAAMTHHKRAALHMERALQLEAEGRSPAEAVERALAELRAGRALDAGWIGFHQVEAAVLYAQASYEISSGADPRAAIAGAARAAEAVVAAAPDDPTNHDGLGAVATLEARYQLREGRDPVPALDRARGIFREAIEAAPWLLDLRVRLARVELIAAKAAVARGEAAAASVEAVREALGPWLDEERADPEGQAILAEARALGGGRPVR